MSADEIDVNDTKSTNLSKILFPRVLILLPPAYLVSLFFQRDSNTPNLPSLKADNFNNEKTKHA
jgi:hypothetical protein